MQNIENILKTRIQNDKANTCVIIVPTDSARLKRQHELVGYHPNRAVANLRVHDIENFVQRLYTQVRPSRQHISHGLQNLWLHEIADPQSDNSKVYRYEAFRPSQDISVPDSTLSLVVDTINHLRERGETPKNIVADNPTKVDLVHIYENYEAKLADRWIDEHGKHLYLANNFNAELMRKAFPQVNLVVIEGFTLLSKADLKILTGIAGMPNIEMWLRTDYVEGNENLYRNIADLVREFEAVDVDIDADYERTSDLHQHFAKNLFRTDIEDTNLNRKPDTTAEIKVLKPADRSEEVAQIAHLIQKHVADGDCQLNDICVAYYNIGHYQQRIAETFPAYGIPYSLVEMVPLTKSEVVKAIFPRLSSHQVPLDSIYFSKVESASHTLQFHPDAFQRYVDDLLKEGEVIQHILNPMLKKDREVVEGEIEAYRHFNRIVKELCSVLKSDGVESCALGDYIEKLHHIAKHTNYQNRPATKAETVRIVQLGELRSLEFDVVFLGDFVEGRFPANYQPDPLLPEIPYRNEEEQLHDNRFMFYRVLKSFRKVLYLLTPKHERAAELIPSPFLGQLKALIDVQEPAEIDDPTQGSTSGFFSRYGNHLWTTPTPSNEDFPAEIAEMRPLIDHVVRVEKSREKTHEHLGYEGVLTAETLSPENLDHLESLRRERYSVTELETYAKCPFQYFVDKVLKFRIEEDETEDEPSGLEKGSLLHGVLFEFYNKRCTEKRPPIGQCDEEAFKDAETQLNELLDHKAKEQRNERKEKLIGENNLFWETDVDKLKVALHKWLEAERTYGLPVLPRYFEVSFGQKREPRDPELSRTEPITIGNVRMTGKIDRIDIGNGTFNIIDYKTGSSTVRMSEILSGRSLQLPVYLQIAAELLKGQDGAGLGPAAGLYHKIRLDQCKVELGIGTESENGVAYNAYNGKDWKSVNRSGQLLTDETFDERLVRVSGYVQQYVDSISKGTFPLITRVETFVDSEEEGDTPITPRNKTEPCNYCRYKRVCRVGAISETPQSDD